MFKNILDQLQDQINEFKKSEEFSELKTKLDKNLSSIKDKLGNGPTTVSDFIDSMFGEEKSTVEDTINQEESDHNKEIMNIISGSTIKPMAFKKENKLYLILNTFGTSPEGALSDKEKTLITLSNGVTYDLKPYYDKLECTDLFFNSELKFILLEFSKK